MRIAILGATGRTGRQLVRQALDRGHAVVALARRPESLAGLSAPGLEVVRADVFDPPSLQAAVRGADVLVSGLGLTKGDARGTLEAGARAVRDAGARRVVWLGALGTGDSRQAGGPLVSALLPLVLGAELPDKVRADDLVRAAGASVIHAGPLGNGPARGGGRLVPVAGLRARLLPPGISRADLAALMLDEAESPRFPGATAVALRTP
ncbi:NAD(P)-dependent oxidoreductase [Archangium primigenium]|uniref:NAD(P)-dependent oxidoreductase n=1 Tax=[Archangium] primigenium TaxID=2792470 RepID=UPI00195B51F5|nr:NAD(P)H-binding protein [Archangium primigenium]MBM7112692.1 NAD(P)H-binding protein [Archangium primigenium]